MKNTIFNIAKRLSYFLEIDPKFFCVKGGERLIMTELFRS